MKFIKSQLIASISAKGGKHVADTTIWAVHYANMRNPRSNVSKKIAELGKAPKGMEYIAVVGSIGRSGHSASDVHIFLAPVATIGTDETLYREFEKF